MSLGPNRFHVFQFDKEGKVTKGECELIGDRVVSELFDHRFVRHLSQDQRLIVVYSPDIALRYYGTGGPLMYLPRLDEHGCREDYHSQSLSHVHTYLQCLSIFADWGKTWYTGPHALPRTIGIGQTTLGTGQPHRRDRARDPSEITVCLHFQSIDELSVELLRPTT